MDAPKPLGVAGHEDYADAVGRKITTGFEVLGDIFAMLLDAVWSTGSAIVRRRFSWSEFFEQTWFLISV